MEHRYFFEQLHVDCEPLADRVAEFVFMHGLAKKICPRSASALKFWGSKLQGLRPEVLTLGQLEAGVLGARFSHPGFQPFTQRMLSFRPKERATAEDLLGHPWLQT